MLFLVISSFAASIAGYPESPGYKPLTVFGTLIYNGYYIESYNFISLLIHPSGFLWRHEMRDGCVIERTLIID